MLLGFLGLIGILVFLVLLIVSAIRKTSKTKIWAIATATCFVLFIIGVASTPDSTPAGSTESTVKKIADTKTITVKASTTASTTATVKNGIDPDKFSAMVKEKLDEINVDGVFSKYSTEVRGTFATVKLYLSDLTMWEISDIQRKEFINNVGNLMDMIASNTAYPGTKTIATNTILYSPGEMELAERTVWGNVKLK